MSENVPQCKQLLREKGDINLFPLNNEWYIHLPSNIPGYPTISIVLSFHVVIL